MTIETLDEQINRIDAEYKADNLELESLEVQATKLENEKAAILRDTTTLPSKLAKSAGAIDIQIKDIQFQANVYRKRIREIERQLPELVKRTQTAASDAAVAEIHARQKYAGKVVEERADAIDTARQIAYAIKYVASHQKWADIQTSVLGMVSPSDSEAREAAEALGLTGDKEMLAAVMDRFNTSDQHTKIRAIANQIDNKSRNGHYEARATTL